jgi:proteic killer suppression protein
MEISYSPKFARQYKKLSREIKDKAKEKEALFRINPFDNKLKTHKLNGEFKDYWSFSVDYEIRIIFRFLDANTVRFLFVGDHDIY